MDLIEVGMKIRSSYREIVFEIRMRFDQFTIQLNVIRYEV